MIGVAWRIETGLSPLMPMNYITPEYAGKRKTPKAAE